MYGRYSLHYDNQDRVGYIFKITVSGFGTQNMDPSAAPPSHSAAPFTKLYWTIRVETFFFYVVSCIKLIQRSLPGGV